MQTLDLSQVTGIEARGNQVILTMSDGSESDAEPEPALDEVGCVWWVVGGGGGGWGEVGGGQPWGWETSPPTVVQHDRFDAPCALLSYTLGG